MDLVRARKWGLRLGHTYPNTLSGLPSVSHFAKTGAAHLSRSDYTQSYLVSQSSGALANYVLPARNLKILEAFVDVECGRVITQTKLTGADQHLRPSREAKTGVSSIEAT